MRGDKRGVCHFAFPAVSRPPRAAPLLELMVFPLPRFEQYPSLSRYYRSSYGGLIGFAQRSDTGRNDDALVRNDPGIHLIHRRL